MRRKRGHSTTLNYKAKRDATARQIYITTRTANHIRISLSTAVWYKYEIAVKEFMRAFMMVDDRLAVMVGVSYAFFARNSQPGQEMDELHGT